MSRTVKTVLIGVVLLISVVVLIAGTLLIIGSFFAVNRSVVRPMERTFRPETSNFTSNGERIFFTGTSSTGPRISSQTQGMHGMAGRQLACASCHGVDGGGGTVRMMMTIVAAPDIRWEHLVEGEHTDDHGEEHEAYTVETFKRAVTEGLDPAGESLDWVMPRWEMTDEQLDDLIDYLKSLE